jgi:hypothetical protein
VVCLKDLMVVEADSAGLGYDAYTKPNAKSFLYAGTFVTELDSLAVNFDSMIAEITNATGNTVTNAMKDVTIMDWLTLRPGINIFRLSDSRNGAEHPETAGSGCIDAQISYRARYL